MTHCSNPLRHPSTPRRPAQRRGTVHPLKQPADDAPEPEQPEPEAAPSSTTSPDAELIAAAQAYIAAEEEYDSVVNQTGDSEDPRLNTIVDLSHEAIARLMNLQASSAEGLQAKARACLRWCPATPDQAQLWENADFQDQLLWSLAHDVRRLAGHLDEVARPCPVEAMGRRYQALRIAEAAAGEAANEFCKAGDQQRHKEADADYRRLIDMADEVAEASSLERGHSLAGAMFHLIQHYVSLDTEVSNAIGFAERIAGDYPVEEPVTREEVRALKRTLEQFTEVSHRRLYTILRILEAKSGTSRDEVAEGLMPPSLDPFQRMEDWLSGKYPPAPKGWEREHPSMRA